MFGECCHCPGYDKSNNQVVYDPVAETGLTANDDATGTEKKSVQNVEKEDPPHSGRSASSLTPEEKAAEKTRLQELVKKFAKTAVRGIDCRLMVDSTSGETTPAKYYLDKALRKMSFITGDSENSTVQHVVLLANLQEIHRYEDGEKLFPKGAQKLVKSKDTDNLLLINYLDDRNQNSSVCFLEQSTVDKERFLTCMKVLHLYVKTSTPKDSGR